MRQFLLRRLLFIFITLALISLAIFIVTEILPGDVATMILGQQATPEDLAVLRRKLGLERPPHVRYLEWVTGLFRGDWGQSLRLRVPIGPLLGQRLRNSLALAFLTFIVGVPTGVLMGVIASLTRDRWPDMVLSIGTLVSVSFPEFVTGVLLIIIFASWLNLLPASSLIEPDAKPLQSLKHLILPAATLMLAMWAHIARMTRSSMAEVMESNYVRTAILKGLPMRKVVLDHALRNALLPTITIVAINVGWLMGGLIIVESVFAYPGMGQLLLIAINNHDVPLLQSVTLVIAAIYAFSNLTADLLYRYSNPRIRYR
jgi:peptide/nickel transport system permease protein